MSVFNRMRPQPAQSAGAARRLFVRLAGSGSGRPLVLLHGLASSSRYWLPYTRLLGGRSLVLPDLLGFGRSPKPAASEYSPRAHIAALQAALEWLRPQGIEPPFDLLGQSAGSLVALLYATACPEDIRRVGLISLPVIGCLPWGHRADGSMLPQHRLGVHTRWGPRLASGVIRLAGPLGRLVAPRIQRDVPPDARGATVAAARAVRGLLAAALAGQATVHRGGAVLALRAVVVLGQARLTAAGHRVAARRRRGPARAHSHRAGSTPRTDPRKHARERDPRDPEFV